MENASLSREVDVTQSLEPPAGAGKFPILAIVQASYGYVFAQKTFLPVVLLQPALAYCALSLFAELAGWSIVADEPSAPDLVSEGRFSIDVYGLLLVCPAALLFVTWHRLILLGNRGGQPGWFYPLRARHWKYAAFMMAALVVGLISTILNSIAFAIAMAILGGISGFLVKIAFWLFLFGLPAVYVGLFAKFSFLFPAVAVDERYGAADAWRQTSGVLWPLSAGFLLCFMPGCILLLATNHVLFDVIKSTGGVPFWLEAINLFLFSYFGLVAVTFITFVFQHHTGWVPEESGDP